MRFRAQEGFGLLLHLGVDFSLGLQPVIRNAPMMTAASLMDFEGALPNTPLDEEQIFAARRAIVDFAIQYILHRFSYL